MRPLTYGSTITVRLDADQRRAIDAAAERERLSASDWVRRALAAIVRPDAAAVQPAGAPRPAQAA